MNPNLLACKEHMDLLGQLADSGAWVDIGTPQHVINETGKVA